MVRPTKVVVGLGVAAALLVGGMAAAGYVAERYPGLFSSETVDRTGPSVLQSLVDLSEYHAASGHYETVVDLQNDTKFLPGWLSGERVLYVGKGDVDAIVDFSKLDAEHVTTSADGLSVTVALPAPAVGEPVLDIEGSYVVSHDKGLVTKFAGSDIEKEAQLRAVEQMAAAAADADQLTDRAKENTSAMLRGLLGAFGKTNVTVTFDER